MSPISKRKTPQPGTLGWRIRQIRTAWGWTQADLAFKLRAGQQLISHWEKSVNAPSSTSLLALANLFGVTVEALESGRGFTIPDLPPSQEDGVDFNALLKSLPPVAKGQVVVLDLKALGSQGATWAKAKKIADEGLSSDRPVWVVIG